MFILCIRERAQRTPRSSFIFALGAMERLRDEGFSGEAGEAEVQRLKATLAELRRNKPAKRRRCNELWNDAAEIWELCPFLTGQPGQRSNKGIRGALENARACSEQLKRDSKENEREYNRMSSVLTSALEKIPPSRGRTPLHVLESLKEIYQAEGLLREPPDDTCDQAATATSAEESDADAEEVSSDDVNPVEWLKLKLRRQWEDAMVGVLHERSEYINYLRERETSCYLEHKGAPLDSQLRADLMDVRETGNEFHINDIVEAKSVHEWHVALGELARYVDWCEEKYVLSTTPAGTIFLFDEERDDFVVTDEIWECIRKKGFQERCRRNGFECKRIMAEDGDIDKLKEAHTRVAERAKRLEEKAKLHRAQAPS